MIFQDNIHPSILALLCTLVFYFFSRDRKGDHAPRDSYEVIKTFFLHSTVPVHLSSSHGGTFSKVGEGRIKALATM